MRTILLIICFILFSNMNSICYSQNKQTEKNKTVKLTRAQKRAAREAKISNAIKELIINKNIQIKISKIIPTSGSTKHTSTEYLMTIKNDSLSCYLPYFGYSRTAIFGSQNLAIESDNQKIVLEGGYDTKKNYYIYRFNFINKNTNDKWVCIMQILTNGISFVQIGSSYRDSMQYEGQFVIPDNK